MLELYVLKQDQIGEHYKNLLGAATKYAPYFGFVIQEGLGMDDSCQRVIDSLDPYKVKESMESSWPGTKILGGRKERVFCFENNSDSSSILIKSSNSFHEWIQPKLPEDLFFLREDKRPWLVNISHEEDCYFELEENEFESLLADLPYLEKMIMKE